ncbi:MAG: serine/threonine protein kinase [Verrucomicrobiae bacterium]|nr:serine/threonine protein kinase [Verrucomicrobiae bacterium]MCP5542055.1 serine/threonine protein kinase [Akkermansiaceae bacterium]MCP5551033.1 serine/threonine protein kinase [Akkermansiaceae bacterium]
MSSQRYEIREEIGKGGLGAVYKAFDTQLQREVAMKRVLTTEHATEEEVQAAATKLIAEAQTLSSLNHPNIVTVFDVGQDEKGGFVVMELLKGETLDETIERGVLTQEDFVEIVMQTMEALIAAQASNVLHRDLKPTNVMVIWQPSGKFQTKILDFGLAKFSKSPSVQTMDQEDAVMGSIYFMAPEQFERAELDARSDLYQMGCVYYHALTSQYPFRGETAPQVMNAHLQHRVTPLEKLRPDLSPSICQWVMWLINREMENRPADAREALERFPRNPEAPDAQPVLQAIPVEESLPGATTGVQVVVVPEQGAAPPARLVTGAAAAARTGSTPVRRAQSGPVSRTRTGSMPVGHAHDHATGEIQPPDHKKTYLVIGIVVAVLGLVVGLVSMKSAKENSARARIVALGGQEAPQGSTADIELALKYLNATDAAPELKDSALKVLQNTQGNGIDEAILGALKSASTPFMRWRLSSVLSERGHAAAVPAMMDAFVKVSSENQKTDILVAVRRVASKENLDTLLDGLKGDHSPALRGRFEDIVLAILRRQPRTPQLTEPLLKRIATTGGAERLSLFRILGALGTEEGMTRLKAIYNQNDDRTYRLDATAALLNWPNRDALPLVESVLGATDDSAVKITAGRAHARMASLPAAIPIAEKIDTWRKSLTYVQRNQELRIVFTAISENPSPETLAFARELEADANLAAYAKAAITTIEASLKKATEVESGTRLTGAKAQIRGENPAGARLNPETGALTLWTSPEAWFTWDIKPKTAGAYSIEVMQAYRQEGDSEFEILVGDQAVSGKASPTESFKDFMPVSPSGSIPLEAGKVYTVVLHARGVTQPRMMDVEALTLKTK